MVNTFQELTDYIVEWEENGQNFSECQELLEYTGNIEEDRSREER